MILYLARAGEKVRTAKMKARTAYWLKMGFRGAMVTAGTLLCCLTTLTDAMAQGNQAVSFDDLLSGIKNSEKKLLNLRVDGRELFLQWEPSRQQWQYAGESDVTAWFTGVPGSKARVDIHKSIAKWVDGAAPFEQSRKTYAYNGRVGQVLLTQGGATNNPVDMLQGLVTAERPLGVVEFASGWGFSLYGCQDQQKMRLSEYLESAKKQKSVQCSVNPVRFNNTDCIELVIQVTPPKGNPFREAWRFDPSRGYAILWSTRGAGGHGDQFTVEKLIEPAPGIYYPVKVTAADLEQFRSDQPASKAIYEASSVVANDPNFSDDIFTIKWPEGTVIEDKISGTTFTAGPNAAETEKRSHKDTAKPSTTIEKPSND